MDFMNQYGIWAIFLIILLEYSCFPVPSEVVLPLSGALAAQGDINFGVIILVSLIAGILGSLICYGIGRTGGVILLEKIMTKFPKSRNGIEASCAQFNKYSKLAVGITRVIPLCRTYISFVAGAYKQSLLSFVLSSSVGILVWNVALVGAGYLLGENWEKVVGYYDRFKWILLPIFALAAVLFIVKIRKAKKKENE